MYEQGLLLEDAVAETLQMLEGERDMGLLFVYKTQDEKSDKDKLLTQCKTIERTANGEVSMCVYTYKDGWNIDDRTPLTSLLYHSCCGGVEVTDMTLGGSLQSPGLALSSMLWLGYA